METLGVGCRAISKQPVVITEYSHCFPAFLRNCFYDPAGLQIPDQNLHIASCSDIPVIRADTHPVDIVDTVTRVLKSSQFTDLRQLLNIPNYDLVFPARTGREAVFMILRHYQAGISVLSHIIRFFADNLIILSQQPCGGFNDASYIPSPAAVLSPMFMMS